MRSGFPCFPAVKFSGATDAPKLGEALGCRLYAVDYTRMQPSIKSQECEAFIAELCQQLDAGLEGRPCGEKPTHPFSDQHYELLRAVYEQRNQRFINDNNKIWTVGSIFIPLSMAGLTAFKDVDFASTVLLGIASTMLMGFWVIIAENHRAFQSKSHAVVQAIERHIGLELGTAKLDEPKLLRMPWFRVPTARWFMLLMVAGIWTAASVIKSSPPPAASSKAVEAPPYAPTPAPVLQPGKPWVPPGD